MHNEIAKASHCSSDYLITTFTPDVDQNLITGRQSGKGPSQKYLEDNEVKFFHFCVDPLPPPQK